MRAPLYTPYRLLLAGPVGPAYQHGLWYGGALVPDARSFEVAADSCQGVS